MTDITLEIVVVLFLLLANGLLAMSEMAIVSARKVRLQQQAAEGEAGADLALTLAEDPTRFLSTVQIGITLIGIMTGAFGGATIAEELALSLAGIPLLAPYREPLSLGLVVLTITYLSLIIGELAPKRLALTHPERIARLMAPPMALLSRLTAPVVWFLSLSTDTLLRLLGVRPTQEPPITEEEIAVLIEQGTEAGIFEEAEQAMVERVFQLGDRRVSSIMTPQRRLIWLDLDDPAEQHLLQILDGGHSRFLVCQGTLDNLVGVVRARELLGPLGRGEPPALAPLLRQPLMVPESIRVLQVLDLFKESGESLAIVVDEYGSVLGLVTLHDVLGAIVGDIPSEDGEPSESIVRREDGSWLLDGLLPIEELKELLDVEQLPGEEREGYHTLAGFLVSQLGHIPKTGGVVTWGGWRFEVLDMDGKRVDKVLAHPQRTDDLIAITKEGV